MNSHISLRRLVAATAVAYAVNAASLSDNCTTTSEVDSVSLEDICTTAYAQSVLPDTDSYPGITIDSTSVTTSIVTNSSVSSEWYPASTIEYCNVTFAYSHNGIKDDIVHVTYWVPSPDSFQNRYVSTGGGGLAINSGSEYIPSGIIVGAVSGITDGGFGSFDTDWDAVFLLANGTINWQSVYMFGYQAHRELATVGKELTRNFFNMSGSTKLYSYYQGCSEGGREGWSQVQRFADQFDGAAIGAPAFRYGQQQVNHLIGNVVEQTLGYYPPPCELEKVMNLTIAACDPMDGLADGIISRSDLCKLKFDLDSTIGEAYSCAATEAGVDSSDAPQTQGSPAQNGTVTAEAIAVVSAYLDGIHNSEGERVYLSYQPGAEFDDTATQFDPETGAWGPSISGLGGEWVGRFLELRDTNTLSTLDNVTYDTLEEWMKLGMQRYYDSLQTTYPDLSDFEAAGGKVIHVHGEQDFSIPTASSVRYYESVRGVMYGGLGFNESVAALDGFYRLYLVPGAGHCSTNGYQPGGPWPQTTLQAVIKWVEDGVEPDTLGGTGNIDTICRWPLRPLWSGNGTSFDCVYHQESIDTWSYALDAYSVPLY
ncbi:hypothetical protein MKZ38_007797 [Zalerion maritima]|uniref:Carboxylic ester hydrolase n=1 Tax=Zalerion maritima TaxID=339359 RepID=A0AAD5RIG6_9PEZI|nr:hypothetical protein MKZ38_007797 [Zalerion maritima]